MSNNKQSSVEWFAQKLYETLEIRGDGYVIDSLLDLAKAMHEEEIMQSLNDGKAMVLGSIENQSLQQYYNETFGDRNEQ